MKGRIKAKLGGRDERFGAPCDPLACRSLGWYALRAMKLSGFPLIAVLVLFTVTFANSSAQTNTLIVPEGLETAFGNGEIRPFPLSYPTFQQIYASNLFSELPSETIVITEIAFRVNESGTSDLNLLFSGLDLALNIYRGPLEEIARNRNGYQFPSTGVYSGDLRVVGRAGVTNAFDIRVPFQKSFTYNRGLGHLVATFGRKTSEERIVLDADRRPYTDGFSVFLPGSFGDEAIAQTGILITRITYYLPPRISRVGVVDGFIELYFDFFGSLEHLELEFSGNVVGPYVAIQDSTPVLISDGKAFIRVPLRANAMFFRLQHSL